MRKWATASRIVVVMITPARLSYSVLAFALILAGLLHLGPPLLAIFFSYFPLRQLFLLTKSKRLPLILFVLLVVAIAPASAHFPRAPFLPRPARTHPSL